MDWLTKTLIGKDEQNEKRNFIWNMAGGLALAAASVLLSIVAKRAVGLSQGGIFAFAYSAAQMLWTAAMYEMRPFQVTDVQGKYRFEDYFYSRILTCLGALVIGLLYLAVSGFTPLKALMVLLMTIYRLFDAMADVYEGEFQKQGRLYLSGKSMVYRTALSVAVFTVVIFGTENMALAGVFAAISGLLGLYLFDIRLMKHFLSGKKRFSFQRVFGILKDCGLLFFVGFMTFYLLNAGKYAVNHYMTDADNTIFSAVYLPSMVINLFSGFVFKPFLTSLSIQWGEGRYRQFRKKILGLSALVAAFTAICVAGCALIGVWVLELLYGEDFSPYRGAMVLFTAGGGFNALAIVHYYALTIMRKQKWIFAATGFLFVCSLAAYPFLVSQWGIMGGAIAFTALTGGLALLMAAFSLGLIALQKKKIRIE